MTPFHSKPQLFYTFHSSLLHFFLTNPLFFDCKKSTANWVKNEGFQTEWTQLIGFLAPLQQTLRLIYWCSPLLAAVFFASVFSLVGNQGVIFFVNKEVFQDQTVWGGIENW